MARNECLHCGRNIGLDHPEQFCDEMCKSLYRKPTPPKRIMMSAVLQEGVVYTGKRHSDVFRSMVACGITIKNCTEKKQGFITDENKFVNRNEAAKIAFENGRIKEPKELLFSEDLY